MKTMTHTPGPWTVTHSFDATMRREIWTETDRETGHRELVALIPDADGEHINGDARLIATAPEMLEALQKILTETTEDIAGLPHDEALSIISYVAELAKATIIKATGGAL